MILCDVNVYLYAHRADSPHHEAIRRWLEDVINGSETYGVSDLVLSAFLRIVTHPRVFDPPSDLADALAFVDQIRGRPNALPIRPGPRHWDIFCRLCGEASARGNLVPDAYLAAMAIESGCEWISTDRDFARFPELRWREPPR